MKTFIQAIKAYQKYMATNTTKLYLTISKLVNYFNEIIEVYEITTQIKIRNSLKLGEWKRYL